MKGWMYWGVSAALLAAPAEHAAPGTTQPLLEIAFEEPLTPLGDVRLDVKTKLEQALDEFKTLKKSEAIEPLERFNRETPGNPFEASVHLNCGLSLLRNGWLVRPVAHFESAWKLTRDLKSLQGRAIADRAVTEWMFLLIRSGDAKALGDLLKATDQRPLLGRASILRENARRALHAMTQEEKFHLCGPSSIATVAPALGRPPINPRDVKDTVPGSLGTSLFQNLMIASNWNIPLQMLKRSPGAPMLVPSVVHWKAGHYSAVVASDGDRYLVKEDIFEKGAWVSKACLDSELSGYMLGPHLPLPEGWSRISETEGRTVWGRGRVGIGPWYGPYETSETRPCIESQPTEPKPTVRMGNTGLEVWSAPLRYPNPQGAEFCFEMRYLQRGIWQSLSPTMSHAGAQWIFSGLSFIEEDPTGSRQPVDLMTDRGHVLHFEGWDPNTGQFEPHAHTLDRLVRLAPGRYERRSPNGMIEVFSHGLEGLAIRRVMLTERRFPDGSFIRFRHDDLGRLSSIEPGQGGGFNLSYEDPSDARRLTQVTGPFGRRLVLKYGLHGELAEWKDFSDVTSRFQYGKGCDPHWISSIATEKDTWTISYGHSKADFWIDLSNKPGKFHRVAFKHDVKGIPWEDPIAPSEPLNKYMTDRSGYYWDENSKDKNDCLQAEAIRYMFNPTMLSLGWSLEALQAKGLPRTWYLYPGQINVACQSRLTRPNFMAVSLGKGKHSGLRIAYDQKQSIDHIKSYDNKHLDFPKIYKTSSGLLSQIKMDGKPILSIQYDAKNRIECLTRGSNTYGFKYDAQGRMEEVTGAAKMRFSYDERHRIAAIHMGKSDVITSKYNSKDVLTHLRVGKKAYVISLKNPQTSAKLLKDSAGFERQFLNQCFEDELKRFTWSSWPSDFHKIYEGTSGLKERNPKLNELAMVFKDWMEYNDLFSN